MITLCGVSLSNYYNKIKLVLLEKEIEFTEENVLPSQDPALLARSPLGKIPFLETEAGVLSESQVILEYLEDNFTAIPLYPSQAFERAKCRELIQHIELNIELHVRRLYKEAFFGGSVTDEIKAEVLEKTD
jgi:glutathione S-transferase